MNIPGVPVNPETIVKFKYKNMVFEFDHILATVSRKKNIKFTEIPGRNGTVKEITGADDHQITFTGTITGANGVRPLNEVMALQKILDINDIQQPIEVEGVWLNDLGIYAIFIQDYSLPQEPGGWSYQRFTIEAISEEPIVLQMG